MPKTKSIAELKKEIEAKEGQLKKFKVKRTTLTKRLGKLDKQIAQLGGEAVPSKKAGKKNAKRKVAKKQKRAKNKVSLKDALVKALAGKKGMTVGEAMDAVLASGYKTTSKSFRQIVNQTLILNKQFKNVERGKYALKPKKKAVAKRAKVAKKTSGKTSTTQ